MKFGKREGLDAENKISPKWKIFHQKWKIFRLCRMFQFMRFWNKIFFFGNGKFSTKVEKIPLYLFGMKLGVLVCPDEQKKLLPKCKIFPTKSGNLVRHPALVLHVLCFRLIFLLKRNT